MRSERTTALLGQTAGKARINGKCMTWLSTRLGLACAFAGATCSLPALADTPLQPTQLLAAYFITNAQGASLPGARVVGDGSAPVSASSGTSSTDKDFAYAIASASALPDG